MPSLEDHIIEESLAFARKKMKGLHSSHGWDHVERVITLAENLCASEPSADTFIVRTSAILHDIAREQEDSENGALCHAREGSSLAREFLTGLGLDINRTEHISDCIRTHRFRNSEKPATIEARILYDADKLDSIGATGIGRAFLFSGEIGARLHNPDNNVEGTGAYTSEDTAYREYMVKLRNVRERMLTRRGRELAEERHSFMEIFFTRLKREISGEL